MVTAIERAKTYIVGVVIWASIFLFGVLRAFGDSTSGNAKQKEAVSTGVWLAGLAILACVMLTTKLRKHCRVRAKGSRNQRGW